MWDLKLEKMPGGDVAVVPARHLANGGPTGASNAGWALPPLTP